MTSLEDAAATLRVVIPGFIALRVIYWFAFRTQRTDLELVLWSLVVSVPLYAGALTLRPADDIGTLLLATAFAVLVGLAASWLWWKLVSRTPELREFMFATAWDAVLAKPGGSWVQVRTTDGVTYQGWVRNAADSAQTSELDVYLEEPAFVDGRKLTRIEGAEGVLLNRASISSIIRFASDAPVEKAL